MEPVSSALAGGFLTLGPQGSPVMTFKVNLRNSPRTGDNPPPSGHFHPKLPFDIFLFISRSQVRPQSLDAKFQERKHTESKQKQPTGFTLLMWSLGYLRVFSLRPAVSWLGFSEADAETEADGQVLAGMGSREAWGVGVGRTRATAALSDRPPSGQAGRVPTDPPTPASLAGLLPGGGRGWRT